MQQQTNSDPQKFNFTDICIICIGIGIVIFIGIMIWLFYVCGSIPETLCKCVFGVTFSDLGIMGFLTCNKRKYKAMQQQLEGGVG